MRLLVIALLLPGFLIGCEVANAGLSTDTRDMSAAITPAAAPQESAKQEATEETEQQINLNRRKRREVQRHLTRIGFDTKVNGKFDEETRAAIARWQTARGYPATGFLNAPEYESLLTESDRTANASAGVGPDADRPASPHHGGAHRHRPGGPVGVIGGMIGGLFGRL